MAPELHYELINSKVAELHQQAADDRRAREAARSRTVRDSKESRSERGLRAAFGKLRTS